MSLDLCADLKKLLESVGQAVALLHDGSLVHGDLTTSNILVRNSDQAVVSFACISFFEKSVLDGKIPAVLCKMNF